MKLLKRLAEALDLERLALPPKPRVVEVRFVPIADSTGDDAVNITVVMEESTHEEDTLWPAVRPIHNAIWAALQEAEIPDWPFIRYRKPSEFGRPIANKDS